MAEPFLSEIRIMSFPFAPRGWALCNGQFLPINQNQALFALLGTTFGGNGQTTFALPNLQGRTPIHSDNSQYPLGQSSGEAAHTLVNTEMPAHTHQLSATSTAGTALIPAGNLLAQSANQLYHAPDSNQTAMNPAAIGRTGGSQAHTNMMPFLTLSFCIALQGIFPSPT